MNNLIIGTKISASTISPSVLGSGVRNKRLLAIMTYDEAFKINPSIPYINKAIYNSIHIANEPDVKKMVFILLESRDVLSLDWLRPNTIIINGDIPLLKVKIPNATQVLVEALDELFTTAGILDFNIGLVADMKTNVLLANIEVSYTNELVRLQIINIIRGLNINEFTYEIIK